jgi:hypothetical protein
VPLQENDYPPPAIQNRADICAINAMMIGKSDLASLTVNCGSQQVNDVVFVKDKCVAVFGGKQNATPADCWFTWGSGHQASLPTGGPHSSLE